MTSNRRAPGGFEKGFTETGSEEDFRSRKKGAEGVQEEKKCLLKDRHLALDETGEGPRFAEDRVFDGPPPEHLARRKRSKKKEGMRKRGGRKSKTDRT